MRVYNCAPPPISSGFFPLPYASLPFQAYGVHVVVIRKKDSKPKKMF